MEHLPAIVQYTGLAGLALSVIALLFRDSIRASLFPRFTRIQAFILFSVALVALAIVGISGSLLTATHADHASAPQSAVSSAIPGPVTAQRLTPLDPAQTAPQPPTRTVTENNQTGNANVARIQARQASPPPTTGHVTSSTSPLHVKTVSTNDQTGGITAARVVRGQRRPPAGTDVDHVSSDNQSGGITAGEVDEADGQSPAHD